MYRPRGILLTGATGLLGRYLLRDLLQAGHAVTVLARESHSAGARERVEVHNLLAQGKTRQDVIQYYITKYGSQIALASPIDKGFNRLAWLLPYGGAGMAAVLLGFGAFRLAHRPRPIEPAPPTVAENDPDLQDKLEDELRNLD